MNKKLLDDAMAAGFCTIGYEIYTCEKYEARNITKELSKFAELQQPQWISLTEKLPFDSSIVDVRIKLIEGSELNVWAQSDGSYYFEGAGRGIYINDTLVTHWMPLPESPTNTEDI